MLPLRLGTVNANGPLDLIVYALTRSGRVETANYSTVKLPSDVDVPLFVSCLDEALERVNHWRAQLERPLNVAGTTRRPSPNGAARDTEYPALN
jgi:hypothetical protein